MGQSKGGSSGASNGYIKQQTVTPEVATFLQQILGPSMQNQQAASEGYKQFLPGGQGGAPITAQANKNFEQQTLPSIFNAFGSGSKGSSGLNQALAAGASNLNTDLASMLAKAQLSASEGIGNLGTNQGRLGTGTSQFAFQQQQPPAWQSILQSVLGTGSSVAQNWKW